KGGKSLPNAAVMLSVPASFGSLERLNQPEDQSRWLTPSNGRITWEETNLEIPGGGLHPTEWRFRTLVPPGNHDMQLVISDDPLPSAVVINQVFSVPVSQQWTELENSKSESRRSRLQGLAARLAAAEDSLVDSLAAGYWKPSEAALPLFRPGGGAAQVNRHD